MTRITLTLAAVFFTTGCAATTETGSDDSDVIALSSAAAKIRARATANLETEMVDLSKVSCPADELKDATRNGFGLNNAGATWLKGQAKSCAWAATFRFAAIMKNPPESIVRAKQSSDWTGWFYDDVRNYVEDGDGTGAGLKADRNKKGQAFGRWLSSVDAKGRCYLPTYSMVAEYGSRCANEADYYGGKFDKCSTHEDGDD
jgi:hypothetical protein